MWKWIKRLWEKKKPDEPVLHPHNLIRRKVDANSIRTRLNGLGWTTKELPIRRTDRDTKEKTVIMYKIVAYRGEQSLEATGQSLDEAMSTIGVQLGVIPRS